jgi:phage shock protein PspC (stress-responsive transcriptional regulator)
LAKRKLKLSKKNRNTISGVMVGFASLYAISIYMDISRQELRSFLISTLLFFGVILVLAILCITAIKGLIKLNKKVSSKIEEKNQSKDKE